MHQDAKPESQAVSCRITSAIPVWDAKEGKEFTAYSVEVKLKGNTVSLVKRFSQFDELHAKIERRLKKVLERKGIKVPEPPKKKWFGNTDPTFVQKRCKALEKYLGAVLAIEEITDSDEFRDFISNPIPNALEEPRSTNVGPVQEQGEMEGELWKRNPNSLQVGGRRRVFHAYRTGILIYWKRENKKPLGCIPLDNVQVDLLPDQKTFKLSFPLSVRGYELRADTAPLASAWVNAIRTISANCSRRTSSAPEPTLAQTPEPVDFRQAVLGKPLALRGGSGALVYQCTVGGINCACKVFVLEELGKFEAEEIELEINVMKRLPRHPNVVPLLAVAKSDRELRIFMPRYSMSLSSHLTQHLVPVKHPLTPNQIVSITQDVAVGLAFLHSHEVIHRDVKPGNVFLVVSSEGLVKRSVLGDYGDSKVTVRGQVPKSMRGTMPYMAPEITGSQMYTSAVDVFSFGMLLLEMMNLEMPWAELGRQAHELFDRVRRGERPRVDPSILNSKDYSKLLALHRHCTERKPEERPRSIDLQRRLLEATVNYLMSNEQANNELVGMPVRPDIDHDRPPPPPSLPMANSKSDGPPPQPLEPNIARSQGSLQVESSVEALLGPLVAPFSDGLLMRPQPIASAIGDSFQGECYALSVTSLKLRVNIRILTSQTREQLCSTIKLCAALIHPNLCPVWHVSLSPASEELYLIFNSRYAQGRTLADVLAHSPDPLPLARRCELSIDLVRVVLYLHSQNPQVVLRTLTPSNVYVSGSETTVLHCESLLLPFVASAPAISPYQAVESPSPASDLFSLGLLIYEIWTAPKPPLWLSSESAALFTKGLYRPLVPETVPRQIGDFIRKCWQTDATLRPAAPALKNCIKVLEECKLTASD